MAIPAHSVEETLAEAKKNIEEALEHHLSALKDCAIEAVVRDNGSSGPFQGRKLIKVLCNRYRFRAIRQIRAPGVIRLFDVYEPGMN